MSEVSGTADFISAIPPTITTTLSRNTSRLLTKALSARRSWFGKRFAQAGSGVPPDRLKEPQLI
jgi:hypothetical protein